MRYWHGLGRCNQPEEIAQLHCAHALGKPLRAGVPHDWGNYVYVTHDERVALAFSALAMGSTVVEVDTVGHILEPDPDFATLGRRIRGSVKVRAVTVHEQQNLPTAREITEILSADTTFGEDQPRYSPDGYLQIPQGFLEMGYRPEDFRWLGKWWPLDFLIPRPDGKITAITDDLHAYSMYPDNHPEVQGRRRIPAITLETAWSTKPGYHPPQKELMMMMQIASMWDTETSRKLLHSPWE